MKPLLQLEHIQKIYGNGGGVTRAIDDISFSVENGEFLGIMGASGSGKTTLLNCISTIDTVSAGAIRLDGQDITRLRPKELAKFRRENLGFIFQDFNLLDTLEDMHRQLGATILMVTHDAFSASYAQRILFLRDGAIFSELRRGTDSRKGFFDKILQVLTMMGGGTTDVR